MADSLSLGDSLFFFSSPPASPDEASLRGGLGWRREGKAQRGEMSRWPTKEKTLIKIMEGLR